MMDLTTRSATWSTCLPPLVVAMLLTKDICWCPLSETHTATSHLGPHCSYTHFNWLPLSSSFPLMVAMLLTKDICWCPLSETHTATSHLGPHCSYTHSSFLPTF